MHTYQVEQVAGSWVLKNKLGEAIFVADSYEDAVALAKALSRRLGATVTFVEAPAMSSAPAPN